jgi:hypothetical protein
MTEKILSRLLHPYWCTSKPMECRWPDAQGPAGMLTGDSLQIYPHIGLFNLMWLMLDDPDFSQNRRQKDREALNFVIFTLQHEVVIGAKISNLAAMNSLPDFLKIVRKARFSSKKAVIAASIAKMRGLEESRNESPNL